MPPSTKPRRSNDRKIVWDMWDLDRALLRFLPQLVEFVQPALDAENGILPFIDHGAIGVLFRSHTAQSLKLPFQFASFRGHVKR